MEIVLLTDGGEKAIGVLLFAWLLTFGVQHLNLKQVGRTEITFTNMNS